MSGIRVHIWSVRLIDFFIMKSVWKVRPYSYVPQIAYCLQWSLSWRTVHISCCASDYRICIMKFVRKVRPYKLCESDYRLFTKMSVRKVQPYKICASDFRLFTMVRLSGMFVYINFVHLISGYFNDECPEFICNDGCPVSNFLLLFFGYKCRYIFVDAFIMYEYLCVC